MANITVTPPPPPPRTFTVELSLEEARIIRVLLGLSTAKSVVDGAALYDKSLKLSGNPALHLYRTFYDALKAYI